MRRFFRMIPLLLCLTLFILPACAEEAGTHLSVDAEASPSAVGQPQTVSFTFLFQNIGAAPAYNAAVLFPEANGQYLVGEIQPGETVRSHIEYDITDDDLDNGSVLFTIAHSDQPNAAIQTQEVLIPISREAEAPALEFTRQLSGRTVKTGDPLTVVYQLKNTGNVALHSLTLTDPLGNYHESVDMLGVGEARTFINRMTMRGTAVSQPTANFTASVSGQSYTKSLSAATVEPADVSVTAALSVDRTELHYGETALLTLTLENNGNVSFSDILLTDASLGLIRDMPLSLPAGSAPLVIERPCIVRGDTTYQIEVSGTTDAGEPFSVQTEPVSVHVTAAQHASDLTLTVVPSTHTLNTPGTVSFSVTLTNNGETDLTRVTLSEATRGDVRTFDVIPAGEPTVREQRYEVTEPLTEFHFTASLTETDGTVRTVSAEPITITIGEEGDEPQTTSLTALEALTQGKPLYIGSLSIYPVLLLILALVLVLLVTLLVITARRRRKRNAAPRRNAKPTKERKKPLRRRKDSDA